MAQYVRVDSLTSQRWTSLRRGRGVGADPQCDRVAAESPACASWEQRVAGLSGAFVQPYPQQRLDGAGQRDRALLASLALAADVGAGAECDVGAFSPVSSETRSPVWMATKSSA